MFHVKQQKTEDRCQGSAASARRVASERTGQAGDRRIRMFHVKHGAQERPHGDWEDEDCLSMSVTSVEDEDRRRKSPEDGPPGCRNMIQKI